jgi:hypothetical protein
VCRNSCNDARAAEIAALKVRYESYSSGVNNRKKYTEKGHEARLAAVIDKKTLEKQESQLMWIKETIKGALSREETLEHREKVARSREKAFSGDNTEGESEAVAAAAVSGGETSTTIKVDGIDDASVSGEVDGDASGLDGEEGGDIAEGGDHEGEGEGEIVKRELDPLPGTKASSHSSDASKVTSLNELLQFRFNHRSGQSYNVLDFIQQLDKEAEVRATAARRPPTREELRSRGFLGSIINGGGLGWIRAKQAAFDAFGLTIYPLRLVYDLLATIASWVVVPPAKWVASFLPVMVWESLSIVDYLPPLIRAPFEENVMPFWNGSLYPPLLSIYRDMMNYFNYNVRPTLRRLWGTGPRYFGYYFPVLDESIKRVEAEELRQGLKACENALKNVKDLIASAEDKLKSENGPDEAFYYADSEPCLSTKTGEFTYELCPMEKASQGGTSLGTWQGWRKLPSGENDYSVMEYKDGHRCWNGPARSLSVTLVCGESEKLTTVREPSMCVYEMNYITPRACDPLKLVEMKTTLEEMASHGSSRHQSDEEL